MITRWRRLRASRPFRFLVEFIDQWQGDRCGGLAAEIAFWGLLGVFPTMLVMTSAFGWFGSWLGPSSARDAERWIVDRSVDLFGADSELPAVISDLFAQPSPGVLTVGILVTLYSGSRGFAAVVRAVDVAYDHPHRRGWLGSRAVGLALTVGSILVGSVVVVLLVLGPLLGDGSEVADAVGAGAGLATMWNLLRWPIALLLFLAWAATIYHVAPNLRTPWRWDLPGAAVAMTLWLISTWAFGLYLDLARSGTNAVFGILGGAISLVLWFYVLANGLLAGAEVNAILARHHDVGQPRRQPTVRGVARRVKTLVDELDLDEKEPTIDQ